MIKDSAEHLASLRHKSELYQKRLVFLFEEFTDVNCKFADEHITAQFHLLKTQQTQLRSQIAQLVRKLKQRGEMAYTKVELTMETLEQLYHTAKSGDEVEYESHSYLRRYQPVEFYPSGKKVKKYWPYWLLLTDKKRVDTSWKEEVHKLWADKFAVQADRLKATGFDKK